MQEAIIKALHFLSSTAAQHIIKSTTKALLDPAFVPFCSKLSKRKLLCADLLHKLSTFSTQMDSTKLPQVVVRSMEEEEGIRRAAGERKAKGVAGKDQVLNCPRCNSNNTKFCYYNNYSLSQPRYFCKSCRRYWTAGGSLRNIPVGGASRKNKRPSVPNFSSPNNNEINGTDHIDIDIDYQSNPNIGINGSSKLSNMINTSSSNWLSSDDHPMNQMLRSDQRELIPFMPMPADAPQPASMGTAAGDQEAARRVMLSSNVEDFKQFPAIISADQNGEKLGDVPAFWNGIFGGGSW